MNKISAIVITYNEEKNISACLDTLKWCDEIIIIDSHSTDKTLEQAKNYTNKIFLTEKTGYSAKKNIGIEKASCEWILAIDADERVPEALQKEILYLINQNNIGYNSYYINRKSFFITKFIKHCGWYPDYVLRLFKKSKNYKYSDDLVHEKLLTDEKSGKLKNELLHYTDLDFEHYIEKMNKYSTLSASELYEKKKHTGILDILFRPLFAFLKMYFIKLGFLDGYIGLILCTLSGVHVFAKYSKNYFLNNKI